MPFETKDLLKGRGYRWEPEKKAWSTEVTESERTEELAWLKADIYGGQTAVVEVETLTAQQRYSGRDGKLERVQL